MPSRQRYQGECGHCSYVAHSLVEMEKHLKSHTHDVKPKSTDTNEPVSQEEQDQQEEREEQAEGKGTDTLEQNPHDSDSEDENVIRPDPDPDPEGEDQSWQEWEADQVTMRFPRDVEEDPNQEHHMGSCDTDMDHFRQLHKMEQSPPAKVTIIPSSALPPPPVPAAHDVSPYLFSCNHDHPYSVSSAHSRKAFKEVDQVTYDRLSTGSGSPPYMLRLECDSEEEDTAKAAATGQDTSKPDVYSCAYCSFKSKVLSDVQQHTMQRHSNNPVKMDGKVRWEEDGTIIERQQEEADDQSEGGGGYVMWDVDEVFRKAAMEQGVITGEWEKIQHLPDARHVTPPSKSPVKQTSSSPVGAAAAAAAAKASLAASGGSKAAQGVGASKSPKSTQHVVALLTGPAAASSQEKGTDKSQEGDLANADFLCSFNSCAQQFNSREALCSHVVNSHSNQGAKIYYCAYCRFAATDCHRVRDHASTVHGYKKNKLIGLSPRMKRLCFRRWAKDYMCLMCNFSSSEMHVIIYHSYREHLTWWMSQLEEFFPGIKGAAEKLGILHALQLYDEKDIANDAGKSRTNNTKRKHSKTLASGRRKRSCNKVNYADLMKVGVQDCQGCKICEQKGSRKRKKDTCHGGTARHSGAACKEPITVLEDRTSNTELSQLLKEVSRSTISMGHSLAAGANKDHHSTASVAQQRSATNPGGNPPGSEDCNQEPKDPAQFQDIYNVALCVLKCTQHQLLMMNEAGQSKVLLLHSCNGQIVHAENVDYANCPTLMKKQTQVKTEPGCQGSVARERATIPVQDSAVSSSSSSFPLNQAIKQEVADWSTPAQDWDYIVEESVEDTVGDNSYLYSEEAFPDCEEGEVPFRRIAETDSTLSPMPAPRVVVARKKSKKRPSKTKVKNVKKTVWPRYTSFRVTPATSAGLTKPTRMSTRERKPSVKCLCDDCMSLRLVRDDLQDWKLRHDLLTHDPKLKQKPVVLLPDIKTLMGCV